MNKPRIGTGPIPTAAALSKASGNLFKRLFKTQLLRDGADWLHHQQQMIDDLYDRLSKQESYFHAELRKEKTEEQRLLRRTQAAISEMKTGKGRGYKGELPVAVILSPYQYAQLTHHGFEQIRRLADVSIHVAKGIYGPVVLTQDAFNGLSRQAPELGLHTKDAAKSSDW